VLLWFYLVVPSFLQQVLGLSPKTDIRLISAMVALSNRPLQTVRRPPWRRSGGYQFSAIIPAPAAENSATLKPVSWFARLYVNLFRSVPLVMVLLWFYLVVPSPSGTG
jgi:hypothetical protein